MPLCEQSPLNLDKLYLIEITASFTGKSLFYFLGSAAFILLKSESKKELKTLYSYMPKAMEVKTHSRQPDVAIEKFKSEGNNESGGDFDNIGQIILPICSYKEAPVSFATILSVYIVLIVIGIFVNGAVSLVMLRGKRFKNNASNFFIFHITLTELAIRLVLFLLSLHSLLSTEETKIFQCKILTLFSNTFSSAIFVSLLAIALDGHCNIIYPMKCLKKKRKRHHLVFLVWLDAIIITCPFVVSEETISVSEIPEANGMVCENCTARKLCDIPQNSIG